MTSRTLERKKRLRSKRKLRVRGSLFGTQAKPRVSVFRSNRYLYAQAIDDEGHRTLASIDGKKMSMGNNKEDAKNIAKAFAENLKQSGIKEVIYDRNGYLYHGVIAAFAESLRENGIAL